MHTTCTNDFNVLYLVSCSNITQNVQKALCYKPEVGGFETRLGELIVLNLPNPPGRTKPFGSIQLLTDMNTSSRKIIFLGSRARPVLMAENLTAVCEPIV
jgi:hypothetical protein